ncbi:MAG: leucyl/phenylalanyl-tRNA--protein transferase [Spirochaetaceae bacterium]|jgi:leucyl/phenylalanyl-tRNA--protein transferase|nr:leucyl/phenylalanyl-tRNA--protein transferase [Spirochaetaceae bacterium]
MVQRPGPDPGFPYLDENRRYQFPPAPAAQNGIVAVGGNLSPGMLLSAYEQGIFPWYNPEDPVIWQSPDPRCVIFPHTLHISRSMEKILKRRDFEIALDRDFPAMISACSGIPRPGQAGTWITQDIVEGYTALHRLGWAHSAECRREGRLAGGCYGIRLGKVFFGESMCSLVPNASKAALLTLARIMFDDGLAFIDCQVPTEHLLSLGAVVVSRGDYLRLLGENLSEHFPRGKADGGTGPIGDSSRESDRAGRRGNWGALYDMR